MPPPEPSPGPPAPDGGPTPREVAWIWGQRALVIGVLVGAVGYLLWRMDYPWRWEKIPGYIIQRDPETGALEAGLFLQGLWVTLQISFLGILGGTVLGMAGALARISRTEAFSFGAATYVEIIRGTPLLIQLFIVFYGVGNLVTIPPFWAGAITLAVFSGAYIAEIFRAGIQSIEPGQWEAARSLGMSHAQTLRWVVLPQATRRVLPPLAGQFVALVKDSSLASVIAVHELTMVARDANTHILAPFEIYLTTAGLYFAITFTLSQLVRRLEVRLEQADRVS